MIVCISDNCFFRDGISHLISELLPEKEMYSSGAHDMRKHSLHELKTLKAVTLIIDYSQPDRSLMFSLLERKRSTTDFNIIVIADIKVCQDMVENILIDAVADTLFEKNECMMKLRCCFNTVKGGQLITRSITNVHWADIKRKAHLTHREIDIFPYIISGKRNKEISRNINISQKTVSQHRRHIYAKLSVNTLAGLFNILSVNDDITGTDTIKNELKKSIDPSRPQSSPGNSVL